MYHKTFIFLFAVYISEATNVTGRPVERYQQALQDINASYLPKIRKYYEAIDPVSQKAFYQAVLHAHFRDIRQPFTDPKIVSVLQDWCFLDPENRMRPLIQKILVQFYGFLENRHTKENFVAPIRPVTPQSLPAQLVPDGK